MGEQPGEHTLILPWHLAALTLDMGQRQGRVLPWIEGSMAPAQLGSPPSHGKGSEGQGVDGSGREED